MANEVSIRVVAEDRASGPIQGIKTSTIAAGAAMGEVFADVAREAISFAKDAVLSFSEVGSAVFDMSQKTGIGAEALSELKFAAEQSGTSMDAIGIAVKKMNTQLFELSSGSKTVTDTFTALGLSLNDVLGKSVQENFDLLLGKLADVDDKSAQSALAVKLFGKSGTDLLPMLADGAAGLEAMRARAHELGIVFDAEAAAKADALGDALDEVKARMQGVGLQIGAALGPALVKIATVMVNLVSVISQNQYALAALAGVLGGAAIAAVLSFVAAIGAIPIAIVAAVGAVSAGVLWIIKHFDQIQEAWGNLWDSMPGPVQFVWESIKSFLTNLMDGFRTAVNFIIDLLNKIQIPDWVPLLGGKGINIPHVEDMAASIGDFAVGSFERIKGAVLSLGESLGGGLGGAGGGLTDQIDTTAKSARELTDAEKALEEQRRALAEATMNIQQQLIDDQIEAWQKGGEAQLLAVKASQDGMMEKVRETAMEIQQRWGLDLPDALTKAFEIVKGGIENIADAAKKLKESTLSLLQSNAQRNVRYAPGVLETIAAAGGLNSFATGGVVPGTGAQLAVVHGGETVIPAGGGGSVFNITVNALDPAAAADAVVSAINRAIRRDGAVLLPGAVMP